MISHNATVANLLAAGSAAIREAFDIAWKTLEQHGSIAQENFCARRAELARQILKLALAGQTDPVKLEPGPRFSKPRRRSLFACGASSS
jgi:hypothetical protein